MTQRATSPALDALFRLDGARRVVRCPAVNFDTQLWAVLAASTSDKTFSVAGDQTALLPDGSTFTVQGSSNNDGTYTVASASYGKGRTVVATVEALTDDTPDGTLQNLSTYGAPIYVPTIGDWLVDMWPSVVVAFDGTGMFADVALEAGYTANLGQGIFGSIHSAAVELSNADASSVDIASGALTGLLCPNSATNSACSLSLLYPGYLDSSNNPVRAVQFITADPLLCVISDNGSQGSAPPDGAAGSLVWYLDIATPVDA